jgi:hypothetical protein
VLSAGTQVVVVIHPMMSTVMFRNFVITRLHEQISLLKVGH